MPIEETHKKILRRLGKPMSEFRRKALKAHRRKQKLWTQEDLDYAKAQASEWETLFDGAGSNIKILDGEESEVGMKRYKEEYQKRVIEERAELKQKHVALVKYLEALGKPTTLEQKRQKRQQLLMELYIQVLDERIENFI